MPPTPKHPSVRARRNKPTVTKEIALPEPLERPELPPRWIKSKDGTRTLGSYHPNALEAWDRIWSIPEVTEDLLPHELSGLVRLVAQETQFWEKFENGESTVMAAEAILKTEREYGLTRVRRYQLGWVVAATEESQLRAQSIARGPSGPKPVGVVQGDVIELPPSSIIEDDPDDLFT